MGDLLAHRIRHFTFSPKSPHAPRPNKCKGFSKLATFFLFIGNSTLFESDTSIAAVRIAAFLFCVAANPQQTTAQNPPKATLTVETEPAREGTSSRVSVYTGTIQPARQTALASELLGRIEAIHFDLGDTITAGQVVCQLDPSRLRAERKRVEAELLAASAKLREMLTGSRGEQIAAARARLAERKAAVRLAQKNLRRREQLRTERLVAGEVVDVARAALEQASAAAEAAQEQLSEIETGPREEQIAAQRAKTKSIEASLAAIEVELEHTQILCPYDASVVERLVDEGAVVSPGQPLLSIMERGCHEAHIGVPHGIAQYLKVGQGVQLQVGSRTIDATLAAVLYRVDPQTRLRDCIVRIEDKSSDVVPGQLAQVSFRSTSDSGGLQIPQASLKRAPDGKWECFVVQLKPASLLGTVVSRKVEVVSTSGATVIVRGDLKRGEHVIASAVHRIIPGMQVRIRRAAQESNAPSISPSDNPPGGEPRAKNPVRSDRQAGERGVGT